MNVQAHMSGQISGQVPNQAGMQLPGLPQQNGNPLSTQIQNLAGQRNNAVIMEPLRRFMQDKIYDFLMKRQQQAHEIPTKRVLDIVRRLEEGLCKTASSQEDYMNLETLETRLHVLIKRPPPTNHNQQYPQMVNSSSAVGTMIPTPGMAHSGNSSLMVTSPVDTSIITAGNSMAPMAVNTGGLLQTTNGLSVGIQNGSFNSSDGSFSNGYQQSPSNFATSSSGNTMVSSMGAQRMTSQMIPTPGFNSNNNQSYTNLESSNNGVGFSNAESTMVPQQPLQQKQHVGGQNSRILHNLGSHMGGGIRSSLQQKSYGFSNGSLNNGLRMMGNNLQVVSGPGSSEGYTTATPYGNSPKPLQHHFNQHQQPMMQGDGYGTSTGDSSAPGNLYNPVTSAGSIINNQKLNPVSLQSLAKTNSPLITNLHAGQPATHVKSQPLDQPEKMNFQVRENLLQYHHHQQFQQQPSHQNQHQRQQKQQQSQHHQPLLMSSELTHQVKSEQGLECHDEAMPSQVSEQFQLSDLQDQFQRNSTEDNSRATNMLALSSGPHDICSPMSQTSQQMRQLMHQNQLVADSPNDFTRVSNGVQSEAVLRGQWHPKRNLSHEQSVQEEFRQRIVGQDEAQRNNLSSEGAMISQTIPTGKSEPQTSSGATYKSSNPRSEPQFKNQQKWLLFLRHARRCTSLEGKCPEPTCVIVQKLWNHIVSCNIHQCLYPRCNQTKILLNHHRHCRDPTCPVCVPVLKYLQTKMKARARPNSNPSLPGSTNGSCKSYDTGDAAVRLTPRMSPLVVESSQDLQPSLKRMKIDQPSQSLIPESERSAVSVPAMGEPHVHQHEEHQLGDAFIPIKPEVEVKMEIPTNSGQGSSPFISEMRKGSMNADYCHRRDGESIVSNDPSCSAKQETLKLETEVDQSKQENVMMPGDSAAGTKSGKPKIKGVSLTELFTPEQVREHITGLRQWVGQIDYTYKDFKNVSKSGIRPIWATRKHSGDFSKAKAEKNQAMEHEMSENSCQLCAVEKLTFEPPPIYCSPCGGRIKRNNMYYTIGTGDTRHYFCIPCYNEARGDTIVVDGTNIPKARLEKKKNDEETEEWWVQCDKCEAWQHQICALFNGRRNDGGQAEYTCPNCYIEEVKRGERQPLPQSAVLGAKDLPRTILSDHIEHRLFKRLKQERQDRARSQGKSFDEVPGAESLVVRVVSSVDKKLEVKQRFLEIFQEDNYPTEYSYKSKVVLLFQKIEGVEVCLFGMYVQEFGSECQQPNQRRVYLSYLDSVKYFRPEIKAVTGEALRTFVYHEILIGYLEYCKNRGFTSCYIWACPPLKGEDYILYCHPEIQKTPKSDKLREWYLAMLRKASKENIVVELTNLFDHFFVSNGECKAKVTAARLPYFDGDYWPGAAEDMINQLRQEEDGRKLNKKGTTKKTITKRALKASGQSDLSGNASKDLLLMHKLGETISPMKEDFIMVHLQHACTHCCLLMVSGNRWVCNQCKNFQLCDRCYEVEQKLEERDRHPILHRDKHALYPVEINNVAIDTKDKDEILESEFFDTRQAFLSLCQGNHYQYDTLRRAKHSSMMVLYHLHNPTAPAFVTTCNKCHLDIEAGQGWRCEICPDYDVCNGCYKKDGGIDHPHKLTNHPSVAERDAQNKEARQLRVVQLRKMLDLLVHASQCRSLHCQYPNCRKVKGLFRHGIQCKTRASGGCGLCKKMWYLLQLHARACKESECFVPRCRDLKEHLRRLQQQSDSRRRAAVMEMMRQRAMEVGGNP